MEDGNSVTRRPVANGPLASIADDLRLSRKHRSVNGMRGAVLGLPGSVAALRMGGAILGIALSIKLTAVVFVPALAIASGVRKSATIAGVAALCFCVLSLPFIWEFPKTIGSSILSYAGSYRYWGVAGISLITGADSLNLWYGTFGKFVALGAVGVSAGLIRYRGRQNDILRNCGLSAALFLLLTPGFAIQYMAYLVPWLAVVETPVVAGFYAISGAFMLGFYTWASNGFPWYLANTFIARRMPEPLFFLELLTWIAVGTVATAFGRKAALAN